LVFLVLGAGAAIMLHRLTPAANGPQAAADFGRTANWVCLPGRNDSCATDLAATAIAADGSTAPVPAPRQASPAIDCFYVYPTVSRARTANAPLEVSPEVDFVTRDQFARFSTVCRPFAPLYRQGTLKALMASALGLGGMGGDRDLAFGDVRDAWRAYLAQYNNGRGVVLVGHSQGSRMIKRLIQEEIEGKPAQKLLVSAMLLGNAVVVPAGHDVGGDFKTVPLCRAPAQTGCVIAYSSFRASAPPPADSRYGRDPGNGFDIACTNPAALAGGRAVLNGYFPTTGPLAKTPWTDTGAPISTPFVTLPGLISGQCVHDEHGTYLAISFNGKAGDHRRNDIDGDVVVFGRVRPEWGLHLVDVNVAQGDLIALVQAQTLAYQEKEKQ
jgi:hypothetical protein